MRRIDADRVTRKKRDARNGEKMAKRGLPRGAGALNVSLLLDAAFKRRAVGLCGSPPPQREILLWL
jgi:hypothetical protein